MISTHRDAGDSELLSAMAAELRGLFPIPDQAATAYLEQKEALADHVDGEMLRHPDLSSLIGHCPVDAMMLNHKHHACFMGTVFAMNSPDLLLRVLPWVYKSYSKRGFSFDYFPVALKVWMAAATEVLGPERAKPVCSVYRWMLDRHEDTVRRVAAPSPFEPDQWSEAADTLLRHVLSVHSRDASRFVAEHVQNPVSLPAFFLDMVQPAMYRVGTLWEEGSVSISQEHAATAIMSRAMAFAYQKFELTGEAKGKALVMCVSNEHHELGGRIVADLLELDGWDVSFLGANTPTEDFVGMAREFRPDLIGMSVTMPFNLIEAKSMVSTLRADPALKGVPVLLGGMVLRLVPDAYRAVGADMQASDGQEAVEIARRWREERAGTCP